MKIPKTLKEAIDLCYERARYMGSNNPRAYSDFQDYLAQKFTVAQLKAESEETSKALNDLWHKIINSEDNDESATNRQ